jgi:pyridoxal phosphate enzyme (YggS family)
VPDPDDVATLAAARTRVLGTVGAACARVGRAPAAVSLVAVSKTVPAERLVNAVAAGLTTLGENRVQEGESKAPAVSGATWHLIGPLQSNKAKRALATFAVIQTVDSVELAQRLDRLAGEVRPTGLVPVLLQVNVDDDAAKAGFAPDDLERSLEALDACTRLDVRGLMTVGRQVEDAEAARPTFVALRRLSERLRSHWSGLGPELSMGMSDDYPVAVEEGSTEVRVGSALFGPRPG